MINKKPTVSIIIRTKNEEKYIKQCIEKIKIQSFKSFEIIIVDNYSTDLTVKKAKKHCYKIIKIKNVFGLDKAFFDTLRLQDNQIHLEKNICP